MKIITLAFLVLLELSGFAQQKETPPPIKTKENKVVTYDSARVVLDIVVDSSGKFVNATFATDSSYNTSKKMIEIAKRRASQLNYQIKKQQYVQQVAFYFKILD